MTRPILAAITLDRTGGGVGLVARLIWQVVEEEWGANAKRIELAQSVGVNRTFQPTYAARVKFGARLALAQMTASDSWVLYSHLSLARVHAYLPRPIRRPYAVFLHGIEAWRPMSAAQRRMIEEARLLIANSEYTARRVREAHPWIRHVAACPLALPPGRAAIDTPSATIRRPTVLVVGRMSSTERYKGHDQLLEAWPGVHARVPGSRLVFVGAGDDVGRLQAKAAQLGIGAAVTFAGFVEDDALSAYYRESSVLAMPSRGEGFGLVYIEAMSHGLPCIGSVHDAAGDVIEHGVSGLLIDQADGGALSNALITLLSDDALRARMGAAAKARYAQRFTYDQFRGRLVPLLTDAFE